MKRRKFITSTISAAAVGPSIYGADLIKTKSHTMRTQNKEVVIEWNAHLFSNDVTKYPFHQKATYQPDPGNFTDDPLAIYLNHLDQNGIDRAVVVHPEPYGDDHSLILDAINQYPNRLKGTSLFYPKDPDAPQKLKKWIKENPNFVSTRFHGHRGKESYLDSFDDPGARALWKQAVELYIIVELHIGPSYAISAKKAIKDFPGCKVLIDHLAEPHLGNAVEYADILDMADFPNVYMKFSGLGHFADDGPAYPSAMSFTNQILKVFGPDRMVMGGVTPNTVDAHMSGYSEKDRAKVKGTNLMKLLNWNS